MNEQHDASTDEVYDDLGHLARQLHEAVVQLGADGQLQRMAAEIPDARERLQHVGQLTETAAHRVLGLVETAQPACQQWQNEASVLATRLQAALATPGLAPELTALLGDAHRLAEGSAATAAAQHATLTEIMLSQDFQDLSGQVIQKVVRIITETEDQLLGLLLRHAPLQASDLHDRPQELQGPQVTGKALEQDDVDDLLASLGF